MEGKEANEDENRRRERECRQTYHYISSTRGRVARLGWHGRMEALTQAPRSSTRLENREDVKAGEASKIAPMFCCRRTRRRHEQTPQQDN